MRAIKIICASLLLGIAFASALLQPQLYDVLRYFDPANSFWVLLMTIPVCTVLGIALMNRLGGSNHGQEN